MNNNYYLDSATFISVTSDLAENLMRGILKLEYDSYIKTDVVTGTETYTEEGQEVFQECLDEIEGLLNINNIFIESQRDEHEWELHRIIMYDIIKIDRAMTKIKPIVRVPNIVAKNLLDTRYRQRIVKNKKKYDRRRNKNVCDITS